MKFKILLFLILIHLFSCKDKLVEPVGIDLYFENPQPINDSELSKIPSKFLGSYFIDENFHMMVTKNQILTRYFDISRIHKSQLDSLKRDFDLTNDKIISKEDASLQFGCKFIGDSIELSNVEIDTIFEFTDKRKMKKMGNCLILNEKDSVFWKVKIVRFEKKSVAIEYLYDWTELHQFDSITKIKSKKIDSTKFILEPSRREFKKYLEISKKVPFYKFNKEL